MYSYEEPMLNLMFLDAKQAEIPGEIFKHDPKMIWWNKMKFWIRIYLKLLIIDF